MSSLEITGYIEIAPNVRDVCGIAQTNADEPQPVYFRVRMVADEEPGTPEAFGIRLSNGYLVKVRALGDGGPGGGHIQLHNSNPSSTAPDPMPDEDTMCAGLRPPDRWNHRLTSAASGFRFIAGPAACCRPVSSFHE